VEELEKMTKYKPKIFSFGCDMGRGTCIIPRASGLPEDTVCFWYYESGNGAIPNSKRTEGFHFIKDIAHGYNFKVSCVDYYSNLYFGEEN